MKRPFLILQLRPEDQAADGEYDAFLAKGALTADRAHRIRLDQDRLPEGLSLDNYAGVIVGGGPGCVSDPAATKDPVEARIEAEILSLMPAIADQDIPFMGCCYGIGILAHHLGAEVSKANYGEPVGPVACSLTKDGEKDRLTNGLDSEFNALVGHKEAVQNLPPGTVHLVQSAPCPFQMIRHRDNVYATQFHPEADGQVFADRIQIYKDKGYFEPEEADALTDICKSADVTVPEQILARFILAFG